MTMKYFTRKWAEGKQADSTRQKYLDNLLSIREELPSPLRELGLMNLQGAKILKLKIDKINRILQLRLSTGGGDLDLTYDTLQLEGTDDAALEARAKDLKTQILFDEIDIGETGYTHSFLFSPEGEGTITFRAIRVKKK